MNPNFPDGLLEFEKQRLFPSEEKQRIRPLACIYIGTCDQGRIYVGQTVGAPESRWVQHRFGATGPFKKGVQYVEWKVIEGGIDPAKLDERESYYIGLYDANKTGYNDTQGNDWKASALPLSYTRNFNDLDSISSPFFPRVSCSTYIQNARVKSAESYTEDRLTKGDLRQCLMDSGQSSAEETVMAASDPAQL
jgi:hypothetical protein